MNSDVFEMCTEYVPGYLNTSREVDSLSNQKDTF